MVRVLFCLALLFVQPVASAETAWNGTSSHSQVVGSGDVRDPAGARLSLSSSEAGKEGFFGAIASLDAAPYRGRDVVLSGVLGVEEGTGNGALWLRGDQSGRVLVFDTTRATPVTLADGEQERQLRLYIPLATTSLKFGATMTGVGRTHAASLRLHAEPPAAGSVSAYQVLDAAISHIESRALNRSRVDWNTERAQLLTDDLKGLPAGEAYPKVRAALAKLGDRHSLLRTRNQAAQDRSTAIASEPLMANASDGVGYVRVPGLRGTDRQATRRFAADLCQRIEAMAGKVSMGMIVDLRTNTGGNMWPMVSGLFPLLGGGPIGSFRDADGNISPWTERAAEGCEVDMTMTPVAVLIGPRTGSSGEAVATAFKGRPRTRFFGQPTAGVATGNGRIPLPDGSVLGLTQSSFLDRTGELIPGRLTPDVGVEEGQDAIALARAWLRSAPG